ncbi:protein tyrosine phosphatase family protein [Gallaecimonas mangrovi]|uniref:beta-lactamase hydrolase domain-containing protein n=1 Tax=Gallaecimonas mangrovi TaxID=2291597 RepID=UPI000E1FBC71|nr:sulfur transferase domain-containing protein [Gallaecimonas mangrovi]
MFLFSDQCHAVSDTLFCAGQPDSKQLFQYQQAGIRTVINLTQSSEQTFDEQATVEGLGMHYHHLPISGANDMTASNGQRLKALLNNSAEPVLLHCGTANRAGGLLAAMAFHCDGVMLEEALALGRKGGLTQLEAAVKQCLCGGA